MLSYLKDANQLPASSDMPDQQQADGSTQEYLTVSGQKQKIRQSTMVLAVLFAVAALGVWFMVKKATPAKAVTKPNQDQVQLEAALAQLSTMQSEMDTQMNSVAGRFYHFNNVDQVAVDELKKNPFKRELDYNPSDGGNQSQQMEQIRQEAQVLAMGMELWSITATPKGVCCMIDDKVLYQGDTYKEMTVKSIEDHTVTLEYKGTPIELKMD
jgi:preprotein translocase subunit SecG